MSETLSVIPDVEIRIAGKKMNLNFVNFIVVILAKMYYSKVLLILSPIRDSAQSNGKPLPKSELWRWPSRGLEPGACRSL